MPDCLTCDRRAASTQDWRSLDFDFTAAVLDGGSFDSAQFTGGAFGHTVLPGHLALGLAWAAAFTVLGLAIFTLRTRTRLHPPEVAN